MNVPGWEFGWLVFVVGVSIGLSKTGLSGFGLLQVVIMAWLYEPQKSIGMLLPLLLVGDVCATWIFGRHVIWKKFWLYVPFVVVGLVIGYLVMGVIDAGVYGKLMGTIVLLFCGLNILRWTLGERIAAFVHGKVVGAVIGVLSGVTTIVSNAAGPLVALYFVAVAMPKYAVVGTSAWCFLTTNLMKLPLYGSLGLLDAEVWGLFVWAVPGIVMGSWVGMKVMPHLSQRLFEVLIVIFAVLGAMRLIVA